MQLCGRPRQIWSRGVAGLDVCDRDLLSICAAAVALKRKLLCYQSWDFILVYLNRMI